MQTCNKCNGRIMQEGDYLVCINCGMEVEVVKKNRLPGLAKHDVNREAMTEDYYQMTSNDMLRKWHISTTTMINLLRRWGLKSKTKLAAERLLKQRQEQEVEVEINNSNVSNNGHNVSNNGHMPRFPEFCDEWSEAVQLKWMDIYIELVGK